MKKLLVYLMVVCGAFANGDIFADPFEDDDFGSVFEVEEVENTSTIADVTLKLMEESIGFSGQLEVKSEFIDFDKEGKIGQLEIKDQLSSYVKGNFFLDVRLEEGTKAYGSFEVYKNANPNIKGDLLSVNELFLDFNLNNKAYFRFGQQNLAWGRGYFFNPTDLVNYEKKTLRNLDEVRSGTFGTKIHIPRGVSQNFYAYIGLDTVEEPEDLGIALKYEFLLNKSEYSISVYGKKDIEPVLGLDYSTSLFGANVFAEGRINKGSDLKRYENGKLVGVEDKYIFKASLGYQKSFDYKDESGKFTLIQEFYYNSFGYEKEDIDAKMFSYKNEIYKPMDFGYYYLANFFSINDFIKDDISLGLNTLSNLSDNSHSLLGSLTYRMQDKLTLGVSFQAFIGEEYSEMTMSNTNSISSIYANLSF